MKNVMIIGAGKQGTAFLNMFLESEKVDVTAVIDGDECSSGTALARKHGIPVYEHWKDVLLSNADVIIETTGDESVYRAVARRFEKTTVIPAFIVSSVSELVEEKENLIRRLKDQSYLQEVILNSTKDAMIAVDADERISLFNKSAERMTSLSRDKVIGQRISEVMPSTNLPRVLKSGKSEFHQEQMLENGRKIITTRIAMTDERGRTVGALAAFNDITEIVEMAEEVTNLKSIRTMLEAIIQSSEEAISVVDENGLGMMINPAYTRMTGLNSEDVVGKPATEDISEGESMHMQVLKTKRPVRGVHMKVGPRGRNVVVNVAPVIVDGEIKGSVGILHDVSEIQRLTDELNRAKQIIRTLEAKYTFDDIICASSTRMQQVVEQAKAAASTPVTILLRGESGTGKELFAHAIHNASDRKNGKFVRVNCAALSESLLESELFGYEEGAFSGARKGGKTGLFEEANGGSIFLDEIGELSPAIQAKLLRVLQENEIVRVGGTKPVSIDSRVIAATNVELDKRLKAGTFRKDLFYRLNRMPIQIPPLRERKEDLKWLCRHLLHKLNQEFGRNVEGLTEPALDYLHRYDWPGNVRELENVLGRAMIHMGFHARLLDREDIPLLGTSDYGRRRPPIEEREGQQSLSQLMSSFEKRIISETLHQQNHNKTKTAQALKISVRNLYYKMEKYGIE
ncbi:MAG TPA: sigma 54-interacting transcriptional regulator [Bacillales bacterium]|nr:sigma 54-interacting transcriptional regulator [Bacillales bacterium]